MNKPLENLEYTEQDKEMLATAKRAGAEFAKMDPASVEKIFSAVCHALVGKAEYYAEWALRETGFGNYSDKVIKNLCGCLFQLTGYSAYDFTLPKVDHENKIIEFPKPAGTVVCLVPVTNPTSTVMVMACYAIATRNAAIICPHPSGPEASNDTARFAAEVAEAHGMPKGVIQWVEKPNLDQVSRLMRSDQINVILAVGGPGMVHAAYSSGNPALGVGPANPPCYVDRTANLERAAAAITNSVSFDNSLLCTCESTVLADSAIAEQLRKELTKNKLRPAVWIKGDDLEKLRAYAYPGGKFNRDCLGKPADEIARKAGIDVPKGTRTLLMELDKVGNDEPFSDEKMWPCLAFLEVKDSYDAEQKALDMLNMNGAGHSAIIHAEDPEIVARFGASLPVCRISVNVSGMSGSNGMETNLPMSAIIGTGYFGNCSVDSNVAPDKLVQWTRCAYNARPDVGMGEIDAALHTPDAAELARIKAELDADRAKIIAEAAPLIEKHAPHMKELF